MKLTYTKITKTKYKFFYEQGVPNTVSYRYGEFYIDIIPDEKEPQNGTAEIVFTDQDYAPDLIKGFAEAMVKI